MRLLTILFVLGTGSAAIAETHLQSPEEQYRCESIGVPGTIVAGHIAVTEIPDIADEAIRRANLQLSSGCRQEVRAALEAWLSESPEDPQLLYLLGRYVWITSGLVNAEPIIRHLAEAYPDFVSGRVLLAGVHIDRKQYVEAQQILDSLGASADSHLWVYLNRLRIRAVLDPDGQVAAPLKEVLLNDRFPPNARDTAAVLLRQLMYSNTPAVEPFYRVPLTYRSNYRFGCKLYDYMFLLTERLEQFEQAIETIEPLLVDDDGCPHRPGATTLLGYAYFVLAAEVAPQPMPANAKFVDRANELLSEGGHIRLAQFLAGRPREALLEPFLLPHIETGKADQHGRSRICNGVMHLNPGTVRAELERGADPNGPCAGSPLVEYLASMRPAAHNVAKQEEILHLVLKYGGTYENFAYCNPEVVDGCTFALYPIFRAYGIAK